MKPLNISLSSALRIKESNHSGELEMCCGNGNAHEEVMLGYKRKLGNLILK